MKSKKLAGTSRRTNVATSQRHDVGSTRRGSQQVTNVVISASTSLKAKGPEIERDWKTYGRGHGKHNNNDPDQWRGDLLLYFLLF